MKESTKIEIPLLHLSLRHEELIKQLSDTLELLDVATTQVFGGIESKISDFKKCLHEIDQRVEVVQTKINHLRQSGNKATKVFSNYKYPKSEFRCFSYDPLTNCCSIKKTIDNDLRNIKAQHIPFDEQLLKEKLQFFSVPKMGPTNSMWDNESELPLGRIPWERITSLGSLLVFNTADNAYSRRTQGSSVMDAKVRSKKTHPEANSGDIFAPPLTILNKEQVEKSEPLHYQPEEQTAPEIMDQLPLALPSLSGIADDLLFNFGEEDEPVTLRRPSKTTIPSLPDIESDFEERSKQESTEIKPVSDSLNLQNESVSINSPPPPPPPPSELPTYSKGSKDEKFERKIISVDPSRASLLESIRAAAGKPKKSKNPIIERKKEAKKNKQKEVVTGDLMSDLFNTLSLRRKGISGTKQTSQAVESNVQLSHSSAMKRISEMIPPPVESDKEEADTSDWE